MGFGKIHKTVITILKSVIEQKNAKMLLIIFNNVFAGFGEWVYSCTFSWALCIMPRL